ncbi:MAG: FHA domain-containing protein, partial [Sandaracinaceae bacterium]|nr:FHA domain-containing protein [Sandaracinaceae bacterium]
MPSIKWIRSEGRPKAFPIFKKITTIGKASTNDIVIDDPGVADHHIQIVFDGKSFVLQELDPDANIEVNSKKKRRVRLEHGDRIDLSKPPAKGVELRFSLFDESFVEANAVEEENQFARLEPIQALRQLHELSVKIMQAPSVDEQMHALLDAVIEATCATKGFLVLLEGCPSPTGHIGEARIAAARNVQSQKLECSEQLSDSIIRHVIETQKPLIISDAINDTFFGKSESVINLQLSSVICAPLFIH